MGQSMSSSASFAWSNPNTILYLIAGALIIAGACVTGIVSKNKTQLERSNQRLIGVLLIGLGIMFAGVAWGRSNCDLSFFRGKPMFESDFRFKGPGFSTSAQAMV